MRVKKENYYCFLDFNYENKLDPHKKKQGNIDNFCFDVEVRIIKLPGKKINVPNFINCRNIVIYIYIYIHYIHTYIFICKLIYLSNIKSLSCNERSHKAILSTNSDKKK